MANRDGAGKPVRARAQRLFQARQVTGLLVAGVVTLAITHPPVFTGRHARQSNQASPAKRRARCGEFLSRRAVVLLGIVPLSPPRQGPSVRRRDKFLPLSGGAGGGRCAPIRRQHLLLDARTSTPIAEAAPRLHSAPRKAMKSALSAGVRPILNRVS